MPFDWADFLELADELAQRDEESALRTTISRAYYSALGKAREFLESEGESFEVSKNLHSLVWNSFSNSSDWELPSPASRGINLKLTHYSVSERLDLVEQLRDSIAADSDSTSMIAITSASTARLLRHK